MGGRILHITVERLGIEHFYCRRTLVMHKQEPKLSQKVLEVLLKENEKRFQEVLPLAAQMGYSFTMDEFKAYAKR